MSNLYSPDLHVFHEISAMFSLLRIEMYLLHGRFPLKCAFTMYTMMRVRVYMEDQGVDKK